MEKFRCSDCKKTKKHEALGLCSSCYNRHFFETHPISKEHRIYYDKLKYLGLLGVAREREEYLKTISPDKLIRIVEQGETL